jgi:sodium-dependent phosphate cotransporter
LIWHPLERLSGALTNALYGAGWLPDPARFNFVRAATRPVVDGGDQGDLTSQQYPGPLFTIVIGAALILAAVHYLGKLLKLLMVGRARDILTKAVGRNAYLAMASGMGVTVLTQSSTITTSVLVPFAGAGILTPAQMYPVVVGANLGTTFTVVFAAFAVVGQDAKIGLQAAFVHLLYNLFAIIVIYVIPVLRPVPLFCAETFARIAAAHKWVIAVYLITVFIALPALVIILVGVL